MNSVAHKTIWSKPFRDNNGNPAPVRDEQAEWFARVVASVQADDQVSSSNQQSDQKLAPICIAEAGPLSPPGCGGVDWIFPAEDRAGDSIEEQVDEGSDAKWHFRVLFPVLRRWELLNRFACTSSSCASAVWSNGAANRLALVNWMGKLHWTYQLREATLFLGVQLFDRLLGQPHNEPPSTLVAGVALLVASKFEEEAPLSFASLVSAGENTYTLEAVQAMEIVVLRKLEYDIHLPTPAHHLTSIVKAQAEQFSSQACVVNGPERWTAQYLAELGLCSEASAQWAPSEHAAAAVLLTNVLFQRDTPWTPVLCQFFVAEGMPHNESVEFITSTLLEMLRFSPESLRQTAVYQKFQHIEYENVSQFVDTRVACTLAWASRCIGSLATPPEC